MSLERKMTGQMVSLCGPRPTACAHWCRHFQSKLTNGIKILLETTLRPASVPGKWWCKEVNKRDRPSINLNLSFLPATCFTSHFCVISTELEGFMAVSFSSQLRSRENKKDEQEWNDYRNRSQAKHAECQAVLALATRGIIKHIRTHLSHD